LELRDDARIKNFSISDGVSNANANANAKRQCHAWCLKSQRHHLARGCRQEEMRSAQSIARRSRGSGGVTLLFAWRIPENRGKSVYPDIHHFLPSSTSNTTPLLICL
jgi:hypothetical protein